MKTLAALALLAAQPSLIPWPAEVGARPGAFTLDASTPICGDVAVAERLRATLRAVSGLDLETRGCGPAGITLVTSSAVADPEGYTLDVSANGIRIVARGGAGLYYGAMTLAQLVSGAQVPNIHIEDAPRFKWRGLMLDTARHFLPVREIETILEQMGQHKLNVLHLHLTDDQGWRIEIKRYPELTKTGAWRTPPSNGGPGSETKVYGGFYTQAEMREIVAYAAARHITVVPEIDLPGHAQAVVAAYPQVGVTGDRVAVSSNWGVNVALYNTDAAALAFIKNVLDEIMAVFPGKYIHLGGDEAVKDQWQASPAIRVQMKSLGLANEDALQSWFMAQLAAYLDAHGRAMVGWDEVLQGGVPANTTVMSWRGTQGAITAARLGHDVVLSPAPTLYFDNLQSRLEDEPAGRANIVTLSQVYAFDVMPAVLNAEQARHILGGQAALWSEYLLSSWHVQRAAFPRVDALSEALWTRPSRMSWAQFLDRMPAQMQRYRRQNIAAADSAFAIDFQLEEGRNAALRTGGGAVSLANQTGFGSIVYTLDGSEPTAASPAYTTPLELKFGTRIKAASFANDGTLLAQARTYDFSADTLLVRSSNQLEPCSGPSLLLRLPLTPNSPAAAPVFNVNLLNSCYVYPGASLDGVEALRIDIARLARNFGLANHRNELKSYPAQTRFGEVVVYQDRCEGGTELVRAVLPDPASSDARQTLAVPIAHARGEHDLCVIFTGGTEGPLYAIETMRLRSAPADLRQERPGPQEPH